MKYLKLSAIFLYLAFLSGCAFHGFGRKEAKRDVVIPAGVDSLVAAKADSMVDSLFVGIKRQKAARNLSDEARKKMDQSDSLWNLVNARMKEEGSISKADKERAIEAYNKGAKKIQEIVKVRSGQIDSLNREIINSQIFELLQEAQEAFEASLQLNPFDRETRIWLARVYENIANRFQDTKKYENAVITLKNLIRVNKGEPELYYRLGINYLFLKQWAEAHQNFKNAEEMLLQTAFMQLDSLPESEVDIQHVMESVPVDTNKLFHYIYFQADTEAKMYKAQAALTSLSRALKIAPSQKEVDEINKYVEWIKWDDGNILASEKKDFYDDLYLQGKYEKASKGYKKLLKELKTQRTRDQVNWTIAMIEFQYLDHKEDGISRLMNVVKGTLKNDKGAPIDTSYKRYFADYGIMCHNMGIEYLDKNPKIAYTYLQQAVFIDSPIRGKSYLELAKLSRNNPAETIEKCQKALEPLNQLTLEDKIQVYQLLVEGYKKRGEIEKAKEYFVKWKRLENRRDRNNG
ncbi:hypothetical protein JXJ21_18285 [candidate division KSB1 bacterium]|nr:hypothetical protein [candidate division KSB1 bacterium]